LGGGGQSWAVVAVLMCIAELMLFRRDEKLTAVLSVKKSSAFYSCRRFIIVFNVSAIEHNFESVV
jgi:hypothetical protein